MNRKAITSALLITIMLIIPMTAWAEGVLLVSPATAAVFSGVQGGPFSPSSASYTIQNTGDMAMDWSATNGTWYTVSPTSGGLGAGESASLSVSINLGANGLAAGSYQGTIFLTNTTNGNGDTFRTVDLTVTSLPHLTLHAPLPTAVFGSATASLNGKIYVIGGDTGAAGTGIVQIYDTMSNSWTAGALKPTAVTYTGAAVINGKIYVPGGWQSLSSLTVNTLEIYDPAENTWSTGANMPLALAGAGVAALNGKLYVISGYNGTVDVVNTHVYDPVANAWSTAAPIPTVRDLFGTGVINGKIYVYGGESSASNWDAVSSMEIYDPVANSWTTGTSMRAARYVHGSATLDGRLYAFGGSDPSLATLQNIEMFDPLTNAWSIVPYTLNAARAELSAVTAGSSIYVLGGRNALGVLANINESYDTRYIAPAEIGIYSDGNWYLDKNQSWAWDGEPADTYGLFGVGLPNVIPVTGDWNGDGTTEIGVYSEGNWYLDKNQSWAWEGEPADTYGLFGVGLPNVQPVTGDWNGSGITKIGVYSDGNWYLDTNASWQWDGTPTDTYGLFGVGLGTVVPVTGNW